MFSLEAWIGLRYLRAKKRNGFMSFITMVSIAGIALGVTALIVVLSVMNGFQKEIRGQLLNVAPHAEIGYIDNTDTDWRNLLRFTETAKVFWLPRPMFPIRLCWQTRAKSGACRCAAFCRLKNAKWWNMATKCRQANLKT